jgi:uncharacterized protein
MEYRSCALETKAFADSGDVFKFSGLGARFHNVDLHNEIIEKGTFVDSLAEMNPLLLFGHKMDIPVGVIKVANETDDGVYIECEMPKSDSFVRERIAPQMAIGSLKGLSVGFKTLADRRDRRDGRDIRVITKAKLYEISIVAMAANPLASVDKFKSLGLTDWDHMTDPEREIVLKSNGMSPDLARRLIDLDRKSATPALPPAFVIPDFAKMIRDTAKSL